MVDWKPEIDRMFNWLDQIGLNALIEHVTFLSDYLSELAVQSKVTCHLAAELLVRLNDKIREGPILSQSVTRTLTSAQSTVDIIYPEINQTLRSFRYWFTLLATVTTFGRAATLLNGLYAGCIC
jgi:hypothetical protein